MNIYHVIESVSNPNAGPSYSVPALLEKLDVMPNVNAKLVTTGLPEYEWKFKHEIVKIKSHAYFDRFGISADSRVLRDILFNQNIVHGHGVWRPSNLVYLLRHKNDQCKLLCSPRGMLTEWAMNHRRIRKTPFWRCLQKPALDNVDCFHVTAESELEDIRRLGLRQPATIIPNGVHLPKLKENIKKENQILFLSRINKKKGLDILIESWEIIQKKYPSWKLIVAGPQYESFAKNIIQKCQELKLDNISFIGEVFGDEKTKLFQSSKLFVLPSYSENFGIVVAEALANAVPVITTSGTPWSDIISNNCGWYIEPDSNELVEAFESSINTTDEKLELMGVNGRKWMEREFSWISISTAMYETYQWLLNKELDHPKELVLD